MANLPRLDARDVSKTFGPNTVLHDAGLVVQPGEIHALVGQNGSGKSTLVKILTGYHGARRRRAHRGGRASRSPLPVQWSAAQAAGVSVVHQDLGLLDHLTVAENIGVGGFRRSRVLATHRLEGAGPHRRRRCSTRLEIPVSPRDPVGSLPASHRAEVAIARALRDAVPGEGLMILDEATRSPAARGARPLPPTAAPRGRLRYVGPDGQPQPRGGAARSATGSPCCATGRWPAPAWRRRA